MESPLITNDHVLYFDYNADYAAKYPLFKDVLAALENYYKCKSDWRELILDEKSWRELILNDPRWGWVPQPTYRHGKLGYYRPNKETLPIKYTPKQNSQQITKIGAFLQKIFVIETLLHGELKDAEVAINRMPDIAGIRQLKESFLKRIKYLREYEQEIGRFKIVSAGNKEKTFINFDCFRKKFLELALPELEQGKIPDFCFSTTNYDSIAIEIKRIADKITRYFGANEVDNEALGRLLFEVDELTFKFTRDLYRPFDSNIIANANRCFALKISKIIKALENPKSREVWQLYNEEIKRNSKLTDANIARKIFKDKRIFSTVEGIKACIKDGRKYSRDIQGDLTLKNALIAAGADLNELPQLIA